MPMNEIDFVYCGPQALTSEENLRFLQFYFADPFRSNTIHGILVSQRQF